MSKEFLGLLLSMNSDENKREEYIRAPFGYPGGKSRSLDSILPNLPYRDGYCEPFGGSGAVLLSRHESKLEIFNDRYAGVVAFYRCLRDKNKKDELTDRLQLSLHSREEFIWCRDTWKDCSDDVERAARWYYMTTMSFGQQGRNFGRQMKGRAQLGPKLKNNLQLFQGIHNRLLNVQIENLDWRQCLKDYDTPDMVFYLDPPYYRYARGMYECDMPQEDHKELLERIFQLQGFVALSGYENELYDQYPWNLRFQWRVNVSSLAQAFTESNNLAGKEDTIKRGFAIETLWIKEAS